MAKGKTKISGELTQDILERFPTLPSKTLARMLVEQHPVIFTDVEFARTRVRYYRGRTGAKHRSSITETKYLLPEPTETNPYSLPKPSDFKWTDYNIPRELSKGLIFGDVHIPYHDRKVITTILNHGKKLTPDYIVINGDLMDFYNLSVFCKDPTKARAKSEIDDTVQFLTALRAHFPHTHIVVKFGNHDDRWKLYIMQKAPELWGMKETRLEVILGLYNLGIEYVDDKRIIRAGKLSIVHGHEFWQSLNNPVNPARGLFLKAKASAICAHHHQTSEHSEPDIKGDLTTCWSLGCCCQLHPEYMPLNRWNHGFAIMEKLPNGEFSVDNIRMIDGEIV